MIRNLQKRKTLKLEKIENPLQLFDVVQVNTCDESGRFTYVGKGLFYKTFRRKPKLIISGPRNLNEFLL